MTQGSTDTSTENHPVSYQGHPMAKHIGQHFIEVTDDARAIMSIPFNKDFIGNTVEQSMHLGPITAVLDSAAGLSVMKANGEFSPFVTLDLRIDQLHPADADSDITVECAPYLRKGDLFYVSGQAWQSDKSRPVLSFYSVFMAAHKKFNQDGSASQAPPLTAQIQQSHADFRDFEFIPEIHPIHKRIPYAKNMAIEVGKNVEGERIVKLPFADRHIGNPLTRALQGGIFLGFLETAGSAYLFDLYPSLQQSKSASFFMEYLKAPKPQDTFARVTSSKIGRRVVNIDIEAFQTDRGVIAKASGRYLVIP